MSDTDTAVMEEPSPAALQAAERRKAQANGGGNGTGGGASYSFDELLGTAGPFVQIGDRRCQIAPPVNVKRAEWSDTQRRLNRWVRLAAITARAEDGSLIDFAAVADGATRENDEMLGYCAKPETMPPDIRSALQSEGVSTEEAGRRLAEAIILPDDVRMIFRRMSLQGQPQEEIDAQNQMVRLALTRHAPDLPIEQIAEDMDTLKAIRIIRCALEIDNGQRGNF